MRARGRARVLGIATALMCALAAGAIWCVLALYSRTDLAVLALPTAGVIAWVLRSHGFPGTPAGALLAAFSTLLACAYAQCLLATAQVASMLGLSLRATLLKIGPGFAAAVAWNNLDDIDTALYVFAVLLAIGLMLRHARPLAN